MVFLKAREAASRLRGGEDEAVCARSLLRSLLRSLGIAPLQLQRGPQPSCPFALFEKLGSLCCTLLLGTLRRLPVLCSCGSQRPLATRWCGYCFLATHCLCAC